MKKTMSLLLIAGLSLCLSPILAFAQSSDLSENLAAWQGWA
jgi:hypothetical protein